MIHTEKREREERMAKMIDAEEKTTKQKHTAMFTEDQHASEFVSANRRGWKTWDLEIVDSPIIGTKASGEEAIINRRMVKITYSYPD